MKMESRKPLTQGIATLHKFHGGKARHIKDYIPTHLEDEQPDSVVIVASGNDLPDGEYDAAIISEIAYDIIECGLRCKENGVGDIYISSVLPRRSFHYQLHRKDINDMLEVKCADNGFTKQQEHNS